MPRSRPLALVLALLAAAACAHAQKPQKAITQIDLPTPRPQPAPQLVARAQPAPTPATDNADGTQALDAALKTLAQTKLFFDTDDATLTSDGEQKLAAVGRILGAHPKLALRVVGNCDERGTEDYNLVLGQKRAEAAKRYLVAMGAQNGQVKTLSYGSERPEANGHDESAWRQNRRDDLVVIAGGH